MQQFSFLSHLSTLNWPSLVILSITHNRLYPSAFSETILFEHFVITLEPLTRDSYGQILVFFSAVLQCNGIWNRGGVHCSHILPRKVLIITWNFATVTWFPCTRSLQVVTLSWLTLNHFNLSNTGLFLRLLVFIWRKNYLSIVTLFKNNQSSSFEGFSQLNSKIHKLIIWIYPNTEIWNHDGT